MNPILTGAMLWYLYEAIQASIDLALKIASKLNLETPESYADVFRILMMNNLLEKDLAERLIKMARFRNLLAYAYAKVDIERVYRELDDNINDLRAFLNTVKKIIDSHKLDLSSF
ncbi:MAG: DUF86 domain-containing protein [Candidatus Asgardarchaeum sp.]